MRVIDVINFSIFIHTLSHLLTYTKHQYKVKGNGIQKGDQ